MKRALLVFIPILTVVGAVWLWPSGRELRFQIISDVITERQHRVKMGATTYLLPPEMVGANVEFTKISGGEVELAASLRIEETPETEIKFASVFWSEDFPNQDFALVYHANAVSSRPLHAVYLDEGQILSGVGGSASLKLQGYPLRLDTFVVHTKELPRQGWAGRRLVGIPVSELTELTKADSDLTFYTITVKRGDAKAL